MLFILILVILLGLSLYINKKWFPIYLIIYIASSLCIIVSPFIASTIDSYASKQDNRISHVINKQVTSKQGISYAITVAGQADNLIVNYNNIASILNGLLYPVKHDLFNIKEKL